MVVAPAVLQQALVAQPMALRTMQVDGLLALELKVLRTATTKLTCV